MFSPFRTPAVLLSIVLTTIAVELHAQTAWQEGFEGTETSWTDAGGDAKHRILQQQRLQTTSHTGRGCEWFQIEAGGGAFIYLAHDVGQPRIIEELEPSVWLKSDRAGPSMALRIALPHTNDPRSGRPMTTVLMGPPYTDVGRWQALRMTGIPTLLTRHIHALRAQFGPQVDEREAYVDAVLINGYGGPGVTNLWIDDLAVAGHAAIARTQVSQPAQEGPALAMGNNTMVPVRLPAVRGKPQTSESPSLPAVAPYAPPTGNNIVPLSTAVTLGPRRVVKLTGTILTVDGRPMFPRAIQHRGEPLSVLKKMGFNVVWLQRLPAPEMLEEAERLGLWLICTPPRELTPIAQINPAFDPVLAWDLGSDLSEADLPSIQPWAEQVRTADRRMNRPLICQARSDLRGFSRAADYLLIDRRPLGTSLQMSDYAKWVKQQPLLARPGTPVWTTVQTQPNEALRRQLATLEPGAAVPQAVPPEQIRLLAYTAVASGSRGLLFLSESPLDASDAESRQRAMSLELLNLELELLEPWAAAGNFIASADSTVPEVEGALLRTERARLLLPIWSSPMSQCVPPQSAANSVSFVVPGVPEACDAFELTPSGVEPLRHKRVAGGLSVTLDELGMTTPVLMAHDPVIISSVHRRAAEIGRRAAELQRHLAARKLHVVQSLSDQLSGRSPVTEAAQRLDAARQSLQVCDGQLAANNAPEASKNAQRASRYLRMLERAYWDAAQKGLPSPVTSPAAVSFDTLPFHWRLVERLAAQRFGPSRIAGGDFEDLDTMTRSGWQYVPHGSTSIQTAVDLMPGAARSGRLGLRLSAVAVDQKDPPAVVEMPPIFFTSPPVQVEAGQIVCVHGWAKVPAPITGNTDGLLIVDSLGGEALAERIGPTKDWRRFVMYRIAPQSGAMTVTFVLSGLGEAMLDDVVIQAIENSPVVMQR